MEFSTPTAELGSLRPILPQLTGRYDNHKSVGRRNSYVEAGMFTQSSFRDGSAIYLPPQWSSAVHPEGNVYFYRNAGLRVVTEADLFAPEIAEQICAWVEEAEKQAMEQDITLSASVELYLQLDQDDCNYYLVDNTTQTVFWLTRLETSELDLLPLVSDPHLKLLTEVQYWTHIENFCSHFGGLPLECIDDLRHVFSHGLADNMTTHLSTLPYDTMKSVLDVLLASRDLIQDERTVCFVARFWGLIIYNRYETHYGQDQARLSCDSAFIVDTHEENETFKPILSFITLKIFETYDKKLNALFVNRFVNNNDWNSFMSFSAKSWQQSMIGAIGLLFVHFFSFFLPAMPLFAYFSASLASSSIAIAIVLMHRHAELNNASASLASEYLESVRSPHFKFQGAAFSYALPRSLLLWSLISVFVEWVINLCWHMYLRQAAFLVAIVLPIVLLTQFARSRRPLSNSTRRRILAQRPDLERRLLDSISSLPQTASL